MAENVTLEFLGAQMERMLTRLEALQEDMRVLTAIVLRHENILAGMKTEMHDMSGQMRAMVSQHTRFDDRLRRLEDQPAQ
jgi:hypothetical protein